MKKWILPLFILLAFIQWFVPGNMIREKENVLKKGTLYKFSTEPIDPGNPFIGKFILLNFKNQDAKLSARQAPKNADAIYVTFKKNKEGYAAIDELTENVPARKDYLKTTINNYYEQGDSVMMRVNYPFDRFYMEESKAPEAEIIYGASNRDTSAKVYALVALYKGDAAIKNVFVNDTAITERVRKQISFRKD